LKLQKNIAPGKNGSSKLPVMDGILTSTRFVSDRIYKLRLQELEKRNALLEDCIEQQSKKLTEVAVTNTRFISIIAHDLRSPFTSIIGVLDLLKESINDFSVSDIEKFVSIAYTSAVRTLTLLDNLLAWTILQNKAKNFDPVKINLRDLLYYETESFLTPAKQKNITLTYPIDPDLNVSADLQMVKTVLRNLISNAIKFTRPGGEIKISATESEHFVEISVKDNGVGISHEIQKELFKINESYKTAGTMNELGTGLGLVLCRDFIEMHGGKIRVESEPGKGSTFSFTLPHYI
jgi:signal transduction histidine kinase